MLHQHSGGGTVHEVRVAGQAVQAGAGTLTLRVAQRRRCKVRTAVGR